MVVVAHADDETIALGARMPRFEEACFVHVTDSAPRDEMDSRAHGFEHLEGYRKARTTELGAMFAQAGLERVISSCLGIPDQAASLNLSEIARKLEQKIADYDPEVIFTHPYEGGHPDHDACAFAVHYAVELNRAAGRRRPLIIEAPFYHAGPAGFRSGEFLSPNNYLPEVVYELTESERRRRRGLLACFTTQTETLKGFDYSSERFRIAPCNDFSRPPHEGQLLYEHYPWGMSSHRFCELAQEAESELQSEFVRRV